MNFTKNMYILFTVSTSVLIVKMLDLIYYILNSEWSYGVNVLVLKWCMFFLCVHEW